MFIAPAYAQAAGGAAGSGDLLTALAPMVLIVGIFYLLLIRPQQKKAKEHRSKLDGIRRGDRIVTGGGLLGTVTKVVSDTELTVEIAQGVRVNVVKATVADVLAKSVPVARDESKKPGAVETPSPGAEATKN